MRSLIEGRYCVVCGAAAVAGSAALLREVAKTIASRIETGMTKSINTIERRRFEMARTLVMSAPAIGEDLVERDRIIPDPRAASVVDRVGDRGGGAADAEFSDTFALE